MASSRSDLTESSVWECKLCTFLNSTSLTECDMCLNSRFSTDSLAGKWQCTHCCLLNPATANICKVCDRPQNGVEFQSVSALEPGQRGVPTGGTSSGDAQERVVHSSRRAEDLGNESFSAPSEWSWQCSKCQTFNAANTYRCSASNCSGVKPYIPTQDRAASLDSPVDGSPFKRRSGSRSGRRFTSDSDTGAGLSSSLSDVHFEESGQKPKSVDSGFSADLLAQYLADGVDQEVIDFPDPDLECRIVLVGKTGHGKSSTANTIFGPVCAPTFATSPGFQSTTRQCQRYRCQRFGIHVEVVDTPGLFDTELSNDVIMNEISRCLGMISPGPHAIVVVLRLSIRFTEEETKAVEEVRKMFGVQLLRHLIIIFTSGDEVDIDDGTDKDGVVRKMIDSSPDALQQLVKDANYRYVVFNNKASPENKSKQVKALILMVRELLKVNGNRPYTSDVLQKVEECVHKRETEVLHEHYGRRRRSGGKHSKKERSHARDIVRDELQHADDKTALLKQILDVLMPVALPLLKQLLFVLGKRAITYAATGSCKIL